MVRRSRLSSLTLVLVAAVGAAPAFAAEAQQQGQAASPPRPNFQIRPITGDLYRSGNGAWHSIFLVTPEGIILADPLNVAHATWLKNELAQRFKVPVKYVIYSHSHWDHVEGAALFKDTATIIAYEGVATNMDGRYPNMPGDMIDRNRNGNIDREDIMVPTNADPGICGPFDGHPVDEWIESYKAVEALDFDTFAGGRCT
jgi:hypothetical protein